VLFDRPDEQIREILRVSLFEPLLDFANVRGQQMIVKHAGEPIREVSSPRMCCENRQGKNLEGSDEFLKSPYRRSDRPPVLGEYEPLFPDELDVEVFCFVPDV